MTFPCRESIAWPQSSLEVSAAAGACFRLPGAPKTVSRANGLSTRPTLKPAAIPLRLPYCFTNVPRPSQRPPRPHPLALTRPHSRPVPRKKRHFPAPPVPGHAPSNPTHVPPRPHVCTISPHQSTPSPQQSRHLADPLETYAHACYPRLREGPTPRHGNPAPSGIMSQASVGTSNTGHRPLTTDAPICPTLPRGATLVFQQTRAGITHSPRTADTPSYEHNRMSQKRTDFAFLRTLSPWKHALSLPNGRGAGTTVLGAPSNLKQAPAAEKERCLLLLRLTSGACKNRLVACASGLRRALRRSILEAVSAWKLSRT